MCVCMYVCMYDCMCVYTYVRTYVCVYVCMYVRTYVCMDVQGQSKKKPNLFNLNLLLYLQLNRTCLFQSTPLYC